MSKTVPMGVCFCAAVNASQCTAKSTPLPIASQGATGRSGAVSPERRRMSRRTPRVAAASHTRPATTTTVGRPHQRTITPTVPHPIATPASTRAGRRSTIPQATEPDFLVILSLRAREAPKERGMVESAQEGERRGR